MVVSKRSAALVAIIVVVVVIIAISALSGALPSPINTKEYNEDQPFVTPDGKELWFTGQSRLGYAGPAVFCCVMKADGNWSDPEEIVSNFAGEPALDAQGNLYFVHHYFTADGKMIEADIYVVYKK